MGTGFALLVVVSLVSFISGAKSHENDVKNVHVIFMNHLGEFYFLLFFMKGIYFYVMHSTRASSIT